MVILSLILMILRLCSMELHSIDPMIHARFLTTVSAKSISTMELGMEKHSQCSSLCTPRPIARTTGETFALSAIVHGVI